MAQSPSIQSLLEQSGWIQKLAARLVGDPHVAEDLVQDTWVTALEHRPDPERPLGAWVTTVLRNNLAKLRRRDSNREHRERAAGAQELLPSTLDVVEKAATHRNLVEAVLALDEPYRTTVLLRFFEQRSYRDIAKSLGVSTATVNSRVTRGLDRLRQGLDREHGGDRQSWVLTLLPLAKESVGLSIPISGASIMSTTLTVGLVSFAAATTLVVLDPITESSAAPEPMVSPAVLPQVSTAEGLLPVELPLLAEDEAPRVRDLRAAVEPQDEGKKKKEAEEWTTDFVHSVAQMGTTESVVLNTGGGDIEIVAAQDGNVSFDAKVTANLEHVGQEKLTYLLEDHISITEEEGALTIEGTHRGREGRGWRVDFVLHMPLDMKLNANTGSGDVTVREIQSDVMVNTGSGDVHVLSPRTMVASKLLTNTGSGDVHIDIAGVGKQLVSNTGSGDVHATIRGYDSVGEVNLNSGSGDLSLDVPASASGDFDLETDNGSITVPAGFGLLVEEGKSTTFARGVVGSGGGIYKLTSGSGDIGLTTDAGAGKTRVGPQ